MLSLHKTIKIWFDYSNNVIKLFHILYKLIVIRYFHLAYLIFFIQ